MEEELRSLATVIASTTSSLSFCYYLTSRVPQGKLRLLCLLPVLFLLTQLPFCFSTVHLRGISAFFLAWLAIFKLLLFAFHQGPLSDPNLSLTAFLALASLPVKIHHRKQDQPKPPTKNSILSHLLFALNGALLVLLISFYTERHRYPRPLVVGAYGIHMYLSLDVVLRAAAILSRGLIRREIELEVQFKAPYLSTSLQDFWGRRWNLMVTRLLHPAVYAPVRSRWGPLVGVLAAFVVSGLMHEAMFYYLTLRGPTGEVTCFFVLQGLSTAAEVMAKATTVRWGWKGGVPRALATPLTLGYVWGMGLLLFFPPVLRGGETEELVIGECVAVLLAGKEAVRRGLFLVSRLM